MRIIRMSGLKLQRGVTLLEALVALVVLSLGLLGIAKLNAYLVGTAGQSKARLEALAFAEQKIEDLRNQLVEDETSTQDYASLVSSLTTDCTVAAPSSQKDTRTGVLASYTRVWCKLGTAMATQVQVTVFWNDHAGNQQTVALQSVIAWDSPLKSVAFAEGSSGSSAGAFAKPPTGRAFVGEGTSTDDGGVAQSDGLKIQHADGIYKLVNTATDEVYLTSTTDEGFSVVSGRVYIEDAMWVENSGSANGKVATDEIFVAVSDAAHCSQTVSSPVAFLPISGTKQYRYFEYRCYVGAAWYGNVGILRTDNALAKERVCLGDPAVSASETTSNSRKPALVASRMYRGYKEVTTGIYQSTGIGIAANGSYTPVTYSNHDFLITIINGSATDASCKAQLEFIASPNPFTGNQGRFYCFSATCPSPLPDTGTLLVQVAVGGTITLQPDSGSVVPVVSGMTMDSGTCTVGALSGNTYPYTCTISLTGWAGASWSEDIAVAHDGYVCAEGASGPGVVTAGSNVVQFADQSVADITVTQNFKLAKTSSDCGL